MRCVLESGSHKDQELGKGLEVGQQLLLGPIVSAFVECLLILVPLHLWLPFGNEV